MLHCRAMLIYASIWGASKLPPFSIATIFLHSAMWLNAPGLCIILFLGCMIGVVVYGFYSTCDPIKSGLIDSKDQVCTNIFQNVDYFF